jgi:hypothetical protein
LRKRMNSRWRWRCIQRPITLPSSTLSAADRLVPRRSSLRGRLRLAAIPASCWRSAALKTPHTYCAMAAIGFVRLTYRDQRSPKQGRGMRNQTASAAFRHALAASARKIRSVANSQRDWFNLSKPCACERRK